MNNVGHSDEGIGMIGSETKSILVSIIIKALNEEANIERCIESALEAIRVIDGKGEVILADSLSTDRTIEIASRYPIAIVQLIDPKDRCCGIGAQLGYIAARGRFIYILDGDMELDAAFLEAGMEALCRDKSLGGVAGSVKEMNTANHEFINRSSRHQKWMHSEEAVSLDMGGLYRREAVESVGYLTNRNLHAFEEFELGARLHTAGWRLLRLPLIGVRHFGHTEDSLSLLVRRWRSRYICGHGELLRSAMDKPYLWLVIRRLKVFRPQAFILFFWLIFALVCFILEFKAFSTALLLISGYTIIFIFFAIRKRSVAGAIFSIASWHLGLAGLLRGFFGSSSQPASARFDYKVIQ